MRHAYESYGVNSSRPATFAAPRRAPQKVRFNVTSCDFDQVRGESCSGNPEVIGRGNDPYVTRNLSGAFVATRHDSDEGGRYDHPDDRTAGCISYELKKPIPCCISDKRSLTIRDGD